MNAIRLTVATAAMAVGMTSGAWAQSAPAPAAAAAQDEHAAHAAHAQAAPAPAGTAKPAPAPAAGAAQTPPPMQAAPRNPALPADEPGAKAALESSPRHAEFVDVPMAGHAPIKSFVVYPERKDKAPVVVVISEIFGLSDWIRGVADQLAKEGFIAIAPDFLSGKGPNGGATDSFPGRDEVVAQFRAFPAPEVAQIVDAVRDYAVKLPSASGKMATVGYCWGGSFSFNYAVHSPTLNAAVVYYGSAPEVAKLASIKAPVLGLYGENDARVNATIEPASAEMKKLGKVYEPHIYPGAGHGFLRQQAGQDGANMKASEQAWPTMLAFLRKHTK